MSKWNIPFLGSPKEEPQIIENKPIPQYKLIKPFSVDPDTGEVLNQTSEPKLVLCGYRDLEEEIQSYADCSLYKILEKVNIYNDTITGLEPELNVKTGGYYDLTDVPDNINDVSDYLKNEKNNASVVSNDDSLGSQSGDGEANGVEVKSNGEEKK